MKLVGIALLATSISHAAVIAEATDGKIRIRLHDEAGMCVSGARLAEFSDGVVRIPGCWIASGANVGIAFLDGDYVKVPMAAFSKPKDV